MNRRLRLWLLVAGSYGLARMAVRYATIGIWAVDAEILSHMAIVPVAQVAVLELVRAVMRK